MSRTEERLRDALAREAEDREIDVTALLALTRERLPARRHRRRTPLLLAGAAVLAGVVSLAGIGLDRLVGDEQVASDGAVAGEFSCPEQVAVDLSGAQDEFLPDLTDRSPAQVADENDAPRWRFEEAGDTARLLLGNADGTLGSLTTYTRSADGDGWLMAASTACGNGSPATPASDALRLGVHDAEPHPPRRALSSGDPGLDPVLVDDRWVYDYSGLVTRHRSLYVAPCAARFCWVSGLPDSVITTQSPTGSRDERAGLRDLSDIFFLADDMVGRAQPFVFLAIPDQEGATGFEVATAAATYRGARLSDPTWGGRAVWVVLLPYEEGEDVRAVLRSGSEVLSGQDVDVDG